MFTKMKKYLKAWWKRHVCDVVPKDLEDLF